MGLFDLFSSDNEEKARDAKVAGLNSGYSLATDLFGKGRTALNTGFDKAQSYYAPAAATMQTGARGYEALGDALGANGIDGFGRARELFQASPGYAAGMESGLDALDRRAASRGMLASGNNMQDTLRFAGDYADKNFGDYVARLQGTFNAVPGQQIALGQGQGGLEALRAGALNSSFGNEGLLGFQKETGIGNANAAYELSKDQTGANILGAIGGGLNLATSLFGGGGMFGAGGAFANVFK